MTARPEAVAALCALAGSALGVAGVYVLAGLGWSLLAGAVPLLAFAALLTRGIVRER